MTFEKSCGAVVHRKYHGNTEILLIRHVKSGYWSFPKGHVEKGETEVETAVREIKEETGLDVFVDTGFRETVTFSSRPGVQKTVVYFGAQAKSGEIIPQLEEISDFRWIPIDQANALLTYDNDKTVAAHAKTFLK